MIRIECCTTIKEVSQNIWDSFVNRSSVGLEYYHLLAVEASGINNIRPYYLIGYANNKAIGIAYGFVIDVDLARMANNYPKEVIETIKTWKPDFMQVRIIEIGHLASLGTTIEVLAGYHEDFLKAISEKVDEIAKCEQVDLCIIRDVSKEDFLKYSILKETGFLPAMGFPIAKMRIGWDSFNGYMASLKSKKRNKFKQKRTKLNASEIKVEVITDYAKHAEDLAFLWKNVATQNNGYQHERLTPEYFEAMNQHLPERSHVLAIKRYDKIVAYGLNLIGDEEYFGVAEGLDYSHRDEYDLYANNIFEALDIGCKLHKSTFNIGVTAYDFKTSIGAELDSCVYFIKAFKEPSYTKVYADFIQENITRPKINHRVFKANGTSINSALTYDDSFISKPSTTIDPFNKLYNYTRVDKVRSVDLYPYFPEFESAQEPVIKFEGYDVIMLGTNSYLGLAMHPKVKQAAKSAIDKYGTGCSGSPLLNGTLNLHNELKAKLAEFVGKPDALLFSTGYQTNLGAISAMVNRNDVLIMDERNHASLIDGAKLSGAKLVRYKHNCTEALEDQLRKFENQPKLIVSDSVFSMEGTMIDLPKIVQLAKKYNARIMLDESHALGVIGNKGRGVAAYYNLIEEVDVIMGTFSKSFASIGGFIAGDKKLVDSLKHTARSHLFSASLPPAAVAAVAAAIEVIQNEPERIDNLVENANYLASGLKEIGFKTNYFGNAIISIYCGHELLAAGAYQHLMQKGVFVNMVTYPAVPKEEAVLRVSLMATHTKAMLDKALGIFAQIKTQNFPHSNNPYLSC